MQPADGYFVLRIGNTHTICCLTISFPFLSVAACNLLYFHGAPCFELRFPVAFACLWSPLFRVYLIYITWFCTFYFAFRWEQKVRWCTRQVTALSFRRLALNLAQTLNDSKLFHLPEVSLSVRLGLATAPSRDTHLLPMSVPSLGKRTQLHLLSVGTKQSNWTHHQMTPKQGRAFPM